jgi:hypothetical protein
VATEEGEVRSALDVSARAAAVAGALVHRGQTVARAANLADAAQDPADAVDFDCARTNLPMADTVPDLMATRARAAARAGGGAGAVASAAPLGVQAPERNVTASEAAARAAAGAAAKQQAEGAEEVEMEAGA